MRMWRFTLILGALAVIAVFGTQTMAKIAWLAHWPRVTLALTQDKRVRGATLYALGRFDEADAVFANIGRDVTYNRGITLATTGQYALSQSYFDAVLFENRWDEDALFNRDFVSQLYVPVVGASDEHGRIAAIFEQEAIGAKFDKDNPLAPVLEEGQREIRKPLDVRSVQADEAWLETLSDSPGEFLANQLAAEHLRRKEAGELHPPAPSPW